jgi:hypothetical protein
MPELKPVTTAIFWAVFLAMTSCLRAVFEAVRACAQFSGDLCDASGNPHPVVAQKGDECSVPVDPFANVAYVRDIYGDGTALNAIEHDELCRWHHILLELRALPFPKV